MSCLLGPETDIITTVIRFPGSGYGRIPHHCSVVCVHERIRVIAVYHLLANGTQKPPAKIPVYEGDDLIVSTHVVPL